MERIANGIGVRGETALIVGLVVAAIIPSPWMSIGVLLGAWAVAVVVWTYRDRGQSFR